MTEVFEGIRDHAQHHPVSFAIAIIIPMTGAYLCITGKSTLPALSEPFRFPAEVSRHATTKALLIYEPRSYSGVASSRIAVSESIILGERVTFVLLRFDCEIQTELFPILHYLACCLA